MRGERSLMMGPFPLSGFEIDKQYVYESLQWTNIVKLNKRHTKIARSDQLLSAPLIGTRVRNKTNGMLMNKSLKWIKTNLYGFHNKWKPTFIGFKIYKNTYYDCVIHTICQWI